MAPDDDAIIKTLENHLSQAWIHSQRGHSVWPSLRHLGRYWVDKLAWQAHQWRRTHSQRQVERRILAHSGRSLRQWQQLVKTEGVFFSARDQYNAGLSVDWSALALEQGFSDQAHLCRATSRITGFSPSEFTRRYIADESFWLSRIWI